MESFWSGLKASSWVDINASELMVHCHPGNGFAVVSHKDLYLDLCCFALYINELPSLVSSKLLMFADDIKLYHTIHSPEDCLILQKDIDALLEWSNQWLLSFNVMKCKDLHIGNAPYISNYCLGRTQLEIVEDIWDLGIQVDSKLKFHTHTDIVSKKAYRVLGLISCFRYYYLWWEVA